MVGNIIENNKVTISGKIISELEFSHEVYGEGFYRMYVEVSRLSDAYDRIPVTISERLIKTPIKKGDYIELEGQFRSYNSYNDSGNKLVLTVFVREFTLLDNSDNMKHLNQVYLNGYICKKPIYRMTPFGREITDVLFAVNRPYNKSDYIPCISWGRNARYSESLSVGDNLKVWGRIQSRKYQKSLESGSVVARTAYEVSISKMELCKDGEDNEHNSIDVSDDSVDYA